MLQQLFQHIRFFKIRINVLYYILFVLLLYVVMNARIRNEKIFLYIR